jgi:mono/diheme cytochrome c family protein
MRGFWLGVIATLVVMPFVGWLYLRVGYANLRADAGPSWFESTLAVTALEASAARHAPKQDNPIQPTEANLMDGARLYRDKCADCHGRPDNPDSDYGRSFYPRAPQFMKALPHMTKDEEFFIIKHGVRWTAMPAWGNIMADSEIGQIVTFLSDVGNLPLPIQQELHRPEGKQ